MGGAVCRVRRTGGDAGERKQLYTWKSNQLANGTSDLVARIEKEIAENRGTVWSDRKDRLERCIVQKRDT